jgi:chitinase
VAHGVHGDGRVYRLAALVALAIACNPPEPPSVVGGYYPNWTPSPPRLVDIDPRYDLIYLFAATPVGGSPGSGVVAFTPPGDGLGAATHLVADLAAVRGQGRKVILSVGGAGEDMSFPDRATSEAFVASIAALHAQLGGFDGLDWDTYERTDMPDTAEMIWISQQLERRYPGFLITTPPAAWSAVDRTFCAEMLAAGALDYAAPQYYDGPGVATEAFVGSNIDTWVDLLGADHVVVGLGVAAATNFMTIDQAVATWRAVSSAHPDLRGAYDWQIDVDASMGWPFATQVGSLIER